MSDIVKRLRERAGHYDEYDWHQAIELEAAARIEQLEKLTEWQPLETVPRSGNVLIFVPDNVEGERVLTASFFRIEHPKSLVPKYVFFAGASYPGGDPEIYGATRWMPVPKEPTE